MEELHSLLQRTLKMIDTLPEEPVSGDTNGTAINNTLRTTKVDDNTFATNIVRSVYIDCYSH
jgi:hypothetical protein